MSHRNVKYVSRLISQENATGASDTARVPGKMRQRGQEPHTHGDCTAGSRMSWLRGTCWAVGRPGLPLTLSCSHSQSCRSLDTTARAPGLHPLSSRPSAPLMQTWLHALAQPTCYCPSAWLWDTSDPLLGRSSPTTLWARPSAPAGPSDRRPPGLQRGPGASVPGLGRSLPVWDTRRPVH